MINCQQRDILKIRDRIPGHGLQETRVRYRPLHGGSEYVLLACGCALPIPWLPRKEQQAVLQSVPKLTRKAKTMANNDELRCDAQYLLIVCNESGNDPHPKLVPGSVLLTCATRDRKSHFEPDGTLVEANPGTPIDKSLQNGVYQYLKQRSQWVGYESIHVEVHKFDSAAIFEAEYQVEDETVQ